MVISRVRQRWGLVLLTILGVFFAIEAVTADWLNVMVFVVPQDSTERSFGLDRFFPWGLGFAVVVFVLVAVLAVGLVLPERFRLPAALAALGVAFLLTVDLLVVAYLVENATRLAAEHAYELKQGVGDRYSIWILVTSGGVRLAGYAVLLLALAAAQLPRPAWGPSIQVGVAALVTLPALALPWERAWFNNGQRAAAEDYWLPLIGPGGAALTLGLLALLGLGVVALVAPQRFRLALAVLAVLGAVAVLVGLESYDTTEIVKAYYPDRWFFVDTTMADGLLPLAAVLCAFAAIRCWWRSRRATTPAAAPPPRL
ncbi:MAG: hypothetical protein ACRDT4_14965 [Micromonosporaceae bacterium]